MWWFPEWFLSLPMLPCAATAHRVAGAWWLHSSLLSCRRCADRAHAPPPSPRAAGAAGSPRRSGRRALPACRRATGHKAAGGVSGTAPRRIPPHSAASSPRCAGDGVRRRRAPASACRASSAWQRAAAAGPRRSRPPAGQALPAPPAMFPRPASGPTPATGAARQPMRRRPCASRTWTCPNLDAAPLRTRSPRLRRRAARAARAASRARTHPSRAPSPAPRPAL